MAEIIVTADRGHFRAYRVLKSPMESDRLELIQSYEVLAGHGRMADRLSDKAGRFASGRDQNLRKGSGEPTRFERETEKRIISIIARNIDKVIEAEHAEQWNFAADKSLNGRILRKLTDAVLTRLKRNLVADLTGTAPASLLERFSA